MTAMSTEPAYQRLTTTREPSTNGENEMKKLFLALCVTVAACQVDDVQRIPDGAKEIQPSAVESAAPRKALQDFMAIVAGPTVAAGPTNFEDDLICWIQGNGLTCCTPWSSPSPQCCCLFWSCYCSEP